jgi:hypothetical protein
MNNDRFILTSLAIVVIGAFLIVTVTVLGVNWGNVARYNACATLPVSQRVQCINPPQNTSDAKEQDARACSEAQDNALSDNSPFDWQQCMTDFTKKK